MVALVAPAGFHPLVGGSELAKLRGEPLPDGLPGVDADAVIACIDAVRGAVRSGRIASAHDVAEGGLAGALAECCLLGGIGASVTLPAGDDMLAALFGEGVGRFVISGPPEAAAALGELAVPIGTVGGGTLEIDGRFAWTLPELRDAAGALAAVFE